MKAKIWNEIIDVNTSNSLYVLIAKIQGFYSSEQLDIVAPYFDKFYEEITRLQKNTSHRFFEIFFHSLLPTMQIADCHIVKLASIKANTSDLESNFAKMLQDGIEILLRCMEIRAFAKE